MKIAFSTLACPTSDLQTALACGKEWGYDGVDIRAFADESPVTAIDILNLGPAGVRQAFSDAQMSLACVSTAIGFAADRTRNVRSADSLRTCIDIAAAIGCPIVQIGSTAVRPGTTRELAGVAMGDWVLPLADHASTAGVTIAIANDQSFRHARDLWYVLDRLDHPSLACSWDAFNAAQAGETPGVSVPTLNSKIQFVKVKDASFTPAAATICPPGQGQVPLGNLIHRLRGIGYEGYVSFEWEKAILPGLADAQTVLPQALVLLRQWITPPEPSAKSKAKPAHA